MRNLMLIIVAVVLFTMAACATPGGGGDQSPGTKGGPAVASQGAQTLAGASSQNQTPQTGTSGTATLNWYFAAQGDGEVAARILALAEKNGWTAEQIANALKATNGSPENVTISTGDNSIQTGPASPVGASSGGSGAAGGAENSISRP